MDAFVTSTLTVTLAEMGDKTQLLSLLLAARFRNKAAIVMGIFVATILNHAASAWLGSWLATWLHGQWASWLLAGSFIALGLWLLIPDKDEDVAQRFDQWGAFLVTTGLFFIAEIGDKTQVATVLLAAQFQQIVWVTVGSTLGMMLANVPVIYLGQALLQRLPMAWLQRIASVLFIAVGVWVLFAS
ncbi:hypothetical protein CHH28_02045 [Bacterioplanes sanyensis]|uniref:GDT1 family protein n=1 Tax=Bacterioplanes sanyensis TaxID=1249553 RepID=A0A222FEK7_9GAMM|nr:TMEM165/GDT1 family protein [Bacterioplanes sanyensis]ASP37527.1 hypothetical protein CHH28_02045 [Bacterioplanes sanyensis]